MAKAKVIEAVSKIFKATGYMSSRDYDLGIPDSTTMFLSFESALLASKGRGFVVVPKGNDSLLDGMRGSVLLKKDIGFGDCAFMSISIETVYN